MLVSFVVTIYNKTRYIPHMLAGLAAQGGDFEREFIFVDDGSTDGSAELLGELTRDWPHTTIIRQENAGPAPAFNRGIAAARGDLIKPMDGDDVLLPGATAALLTALAATGLAVAFGGCRTYAPEAPGGPAALLDGARVQPGAVTVIGDSLRQSLRHTMSNPSGWLATAERVRRSGGCDPRVFIQDVSIELRLARLGDFADVGVPVFLAPEAAPGRLSDNEAQILHDYNLALGHFLADHPDLAPAHRRFAARRMFGCAWKWRRRKEKGSALSSREFWAFVASRLGWLPGRREALIGLACGTFRRTHALRLARSPERPDRRNPAETP